MELRSGFAFFSFFFFRFSIRLSQGSQQGAHTGCQSKAETHDGQPASCTELFVEPTPAEQTDENAQCEVESNRRVTADSFPAFVHRY